MKSSFCIDLQRFMLIPTKFPLSPKNLRLSAEYALVNDRTLSKHNYSLVNTELSIKF